MPPKTTKKRRFFVSVLSEIKKDKRAFAVYLSLNALIAAIIVRAVIEARWDIIPSGVLAMVLLLLPPALEKGFRLKMPTTLEIVVYIFVFSSAVLGEIEDFYRIFPFWDMMLHAMNGFIFAAVGFCLVDIFHRTDRLGHTLSPFFLSLVAFCFAMTIGVLWEFFEYGADSILHTDMQKDYFVRNLHTVSLPNGTGAKVTHFTDITRVTVENAAGECVEMEGYLDVGLRDTMKDLMMNFAGAALFSVIGFFYVTRRGNGKIAKQFIPTLEEYEAKKEGEE